MTIRMFLLVAFLAIASAGSTKAHGQEVTPPAAAKKDFCSDSREDVKAYCKDLNDLQDKINSGATEAQLRQILNKLDLSHPVATDKFVTATATRALAAATARAIDNVPKATASTAMADAGQARRDQQLSAGHNASGTTSLVSKSGSAELLSLALDTGALTKSVNGATITLSTNADQIFRLVTGSDPDCTVTCKNSRFEELVLSRTNVFATLDAAQQSGTTTISSGQASGTTPSGVNNVTIPTGVGKLSGITARYQLRNNFDPRSKTFQDNWREAIRGEVSTAAISVRDATIAVMKSLTANPALALDRSEIERRAKSDRSGATLADYFDNYFSTASEQAFQEPALEVDVLQAVQSRAMYRKAWFDALDQAAGTLLTLEYNYNRPLNQPFTHNLKLILGYDFGIRGTLTFNGAVSLYDSVPPAAKFGRVHYGQVSTQYDRTLSGKDRSVQTQLSLAGYWQYQPEPSVLNIAAGTLVPGTDIPLPNGTQEFVGTAGSLWVTQAKLTIKASQGISVPIGISWSNKTDLLQGSRVGAQFGLSYNFSSLASLFTGGSQ